MSTTLDLDFLELTNFRSIVERQQVRLNTKGLYLIQGTNKDTGGSSGVGKSSINLGIAYALDYCPYPATELQSWLTDQSMAVALMMRTSEGPFLVQRGMGGLALRDPPETGKALRGKAAQAELQKRLGLTSAMLAALTYRRQGSVGTFLSKTNVQIQEFFTEVLALTPFEQAVEASEARGKLLKEQQTTLKGKFEVLRVQLQEGQRQLQEAEGAYQPPDLTTLQARVDAALAEAAKWKGIRADVEAKRTSYQGQSYEAVRGATAELGAELARTEGALQAARVGAHDLMGKTSQLREAIAERARIQDDGDAQRCSECGRPFEEDAEAEEAHQRQTKDRLARASERITRLEAEMEAGRLALAEGGRLLEVKKDLQTRLEAAEASASQAFHANLLALQKASEEALRRSQGAEGNANLARGELGTLQAKDANARHNLEWRRSQQETVAKGLATEELALKNAETALFAEQDFQLMVGREGFLGAIFDEVLAEVAEETNRIMAQVANVSEVTLSFRSESLTAKGKPVRAITPVVSIRGHEAPLESGASGGMKSAIHLAADLAVIDVVSRRLGVSPGWLVLDEVFEGLGPVEKEGYLEVLQVYAEKKLVLVVDHSTETKEYFRSHIDLVFQGGCTHIEQV